jgi:Sigma-70 region 2
MTVRWPGLVRLAYGLTGDRWLAEDVAQAALASAYAAWWRVCRADDPDAYVRRILINTSHRRFRPRRVAEQAHQPHDLPDAAVADPAELIGQRSVLLAAVRELPTRQRRAGQSAGRVPGGQAVRRRFAAGPAGPGRRAAVCRARGAGGPHADRGHRV